MFTIRRILIDDAKPLLGLCRQLDEETSYMLYEPGERVMSLDEQREQIESILKSDNQMIFVAESGDRLAGHLQAFGGRVRRNRQTVYLVIGILQECIGKGIGQALFHAMEKWARETGMHRLELTVMIHNERAIALYRKLGFEVEGTAKDSLFVNGQYIDEYFMAKLI
jgi:RimJ/RimL family protein N-acetyltransferase